jgi:hypothetical protein
MNIQAKVALDKERHPERYCPARRCLWRTGGGHCPRHDPVMQEDPAYTDRERQLEEIGGDTELF